MPWFARVGNERNLQEIILTGEPEIVVVTRRSARARRLSLRVSSIDGRVSLSLPKRCSHGEAERFVRAKEGWIRRHLARQPARTAPVPGAILPFRGRQIEVAISPDRRISLNGDILSVPGPEERIGDRVRAFLKTEARGRLVPAATGYATRLNRRMGRVTLRDTRSRWGSCTSEGNLMFSWRLIMAPDPVLDYVAAHEVAHLIEMNHSPAFWQIVETLCPGYQTQRQWLRDNGTSLHGIEF